MDSLMNHHIVGLRKLPLNWFEGKLYPIRNVLILKTNFKWSSKRHSRLYQVTIITGHWNHFKNWYFQHSLICSGLTAYNLFIQHSKAVYQFFTWGSKHNLIVKLSPSNKYIQHICNLFVYWCSRKQPHGE